MRKKQYYLAKVTILINIGVFFITVSCELQNETTPQINIPDLIEKKIDLKLSDVFSEVSYIPLESSSVSYISRVKQFIVDNEFILVLDLDYPKLLQFTEQGSFVGEFMEKGRGPGEFFEIGSIDVNEKRELLILRNGQYIDILDYNKTLKNSIKFDKTPKMARWVTPEIIVVFYPYSSYFRNDGYEITFIDRNGNVLKRALRRQFAPNEKRGMGARIISGRNNGTIYYWSHQCDTVYTITKSMEVYPRCVFQHDGRHIPVEKFRNPNTTRSENTYSVESYSEWGDYKFVFFIYGRHGFRGVINRNLNLSGNVIFDYNEWREPGLLNDIDGGFAFWPNESQIDGSKVIALDPILLQNTYNHNIEIELSVDSEKQEFLKKSIIDRLNIMSNPVLMRVK